MSTRPERPPAGAGGALHAGRPWLGLAVDDDTSF